MVLFQFPGQPPKRIRSSGAPTKQVPHRVLEANLQSESRATLDKPVAPIQDRPTLSYIQLQGMESFCTKKYS